MVSRLLGTTALEAFLECRLRSDQTTSLTIAAISVATSSTVLNNRTLAANATDILTPHGSTFAGPQA